MGDDQNNDRIYHFFFNGGKEGKMNIDVLLIGINLNLIYGTQGSIKM